MLTVDIARLQQIVDAGVTQPVISEVLAANIPAAFRDPEGRWFGLTSRARIVYAARDRVKPGEITPYEGLADPQWKGRICTRSGLHDYNVALLAATPQYWMKDDHDTLSDDCWPGMDPDFMKPLTFEAGRKLFLEQAPVAEPLYRTFRWGKGLQIWLLEGRDFRSPNTDPDGPQKTILGAAQKQWLKSSVAASDADYKIIISPTPWVGPDREKKNDNYANAGFATEGAEMRAWAASQKNVYVICGDRHWQYHSVDPKTGLHEFSTGPASDAHAGGSPGENKEVHKFHRVKGGYVSVEVAPAGNASKLVIRLHDVNGAPVYEWTAP